MPLSQAIMWEIFPFRQRGLAMAVWGMGIMMAPIFGPTLGGWIADNWSWRWIFYINVPIGVLGAFAASAVLFDPPYLHKPGGVDAPGLALMVIGFLSLQLFLDQGERYEWFDSRLIIALGVIATLALAGFLLREVTAAEPILDLGVYRDRNFAASSLIMLVVMFGFFSSMVLLALFTQKVLGYDAWTSGTVLAPGGLGDLVSLIIAGRLINRVDQRILLAVGCVLNAWAAWSMSELTLGVDYWGLAWPRFVQGLGIGLIFVPLNAVALATIPREAMGNATALLNVVRNLGRRHGRRARQHDAGAARAASPVRRWSRTSTRSTRRRPRVCRVDRPLQAAGLGRLHGAASRAGDRVPRGDTSGAGAFLRRRLHRAVLSLLLDLAPAAAPSASARRAGRVGPQTPRRRARAGAHGVTWVPT